MFTSRTNTYKFLILTKKSALYTEQPNTSSNVSQKLTNFSSEDMFEDLSVKVRNNTCLKLGYILMTKPCFLHLFSDHDDAKSRPSFSR